MLADFNPTNLNIRLDNNVNEKRTIQIKVVEGGSECFVNGSIIKKLVFQSKL